MNDKKISSNSNLNKNNYTASNVISSIFKKNDFKLSDINLHVATAPSNSTNSKPFPDSKQVYIERKKSGMETSSSSIPLFKSEIKLEEMKEIKSVNNISFKENLLVEYEKRENELKKNQKAEQHNLDFNDEEYSENYSQTNDFYCGG